MEGKGGSGPKEAGTNLEGFNSFSVFGLISF
jgi:hypothetical protein